MNKSEFREKSFFDGTVFRWRSNAQVVPDDILTRVGVSPDLIKVCTEVRARELRALMPSGKTTAQMQKAPVGAIYVWPNAKLDYPKKLAIALGRPDLVIKSPGWLIARNVREFPPLSVVIDHATTLTFENMEALDILEHVGLVAR